MRRLLLARHGQSVSNAVRRFQGALDSVNDTAHLDGLAEVTGAPGLQP
jgi:broad specificity phosphatase PhoE